MITNNNTPFTHEALKYTQTMSIRKRIYLGFAAIALILVVAMSIVLTKVIYAKNFISHIANYDLQTYDSYIDINGGIYRSQGAMFAWILTHDPKYKKEFDTAWDIITDAENGLTSDIHRWANTEYVNDWNQIAAALHQLKENQTKVFNYTGDTTAQLQLVNSNVIPALNNLLDHIDGPLKAEGTRGGGMYDIHLDQLENGTHKVLDDISIIETTEYIMLTVLILACFIIAISTSRGITNYINLFRQHSSNIATGDLRQRISIKSNDEMSQLGNDLNKMTESLALVTKQITDACHDMVTTLNEVKHSADLQSTGATEQASSINEITSSLEEIEKSSTQTIDKAKSLGEIAERTRAKGQLGLEAVEQSTQGMKTVRDKVQAIAQTILDLSNQTQQVGEITAVVNSLAQQSKMLALNASIEAAKAGDAGKGFAVVAAEVKNLAEQSEHSTSQVQKILEDIRHATEKAVMATEEGIKGVDHGTTLVEETGEVVRNLSDVIHETTIASQQIEAAIRQEGVGIEQITAGMNEINQVTYSYVESVKQTNEAINNLAKNVKNLKEFIDVYKI